MTAPAPSVLRLEASCLLPGVGWLHLRLVPAEAGWRVWADPPAPLPSFLAAESRDRHALALWMVGLDGHALSRLAAGQTA